MTEEASIIETKKIKINSFQQLDVFTNIQMFVKKKIIFTKIIFTVIHFQRFSTV